MQDEEFDVCDLYNVVEIKKRNKKRKKITVFMCFLTFIFCVIFVFLPGGYGVLSSKMPLKNYSVSFLLLIFFEIAAWISTTGFFVYLFFHEKEK